MTEKNIVGRPPTFKTPEEMQVKIDAYFKDVRKRGDIPLVAELALFIGFSSRNSFNEYGRKKEFTGIIERAREKCGIELNKRALMNEVNANIAKLNLASNHGMSDKVETVERKIDLTAELTDEQLEAQISKLESN